MHHDQLISCYNNIIVMSTIIIVLHLKGCPSDRAQAYACSYGTPSNSLNKHDESGL